MRSESNDLTRRRCPQVRSYSNLNRGQIERGLRRELFESFAVAGEIESLRECSLTRRRKGDIYTVPTGFAAVPPSGPAIPSVASACIEFRPISRGFGHDSGHRFADRAFLLDQRLIHTKDIRLRCVCIGHVTGEKNTGRSTWHICDAMGQKAPGTRFRQSQGSRASSSRLTKTSSIDSPRDEKIAAPRVEVTIASARLTSAAGPKAGEDPLHRVVSNSPAQFPRSREPFPRPLPPPTILPFRQFDRFETRTRRMEDEALQNRQNKINEHGL